MAGDADIEPKVDPRTQLYVRLQIASAAKQTNRLFKELDRKVDKLVEAEVSRSAREQAQEQFEARQVRGSDLSWKKLGVLLTMAGVLGGAFAYVAHLVHG